MRKEAEEKVRKEAEEKARKEAEAKARKEAEAKARKEAEAKARKEAEAKARKEAEAQARKEAEAKARKEAEARKEARKEAKARKEARKEAEAKARKEARKEAEKQKERQKWTARKPSVIEYQEGVKCAQHAINNLLQKKVCNTEQLKRISSGRTGDWSDTEIVQWFTKIYPKKYSATALDNPDLKVSWDEPNCIGFLINIKDHWTCVRKWNTKWYHIDSKCEMGTNSGSCGYENCNTCTFMNTSYQPHIQDITNKITNITPIDFASEFAIKVTGSSQYFKLIQIIEKL